MTRRVSSLAALLACAVASCARPAPTAPAPRSEPGFHGAIERVSSARAEAMRSGGAWKEGCPVPIAELAVVRFTHHTPDAGDAEGELVVHARVADEVLGILRELFERGVVLRRAHPIERYGGDDDASMRDDNTSAFNCRPRTPAAAPGGGTTAVFSSHSYGLAIDLNPLENPYYRPKDPAAFARYVETAGAGPRGDPAADAHAHAHAGARAPRDLAAALAVFCSADPERCDVLPGEARPFVAPEARSRAPRMTASFAVPVFAARGWTWGGTWPVDVSDRIRTDTQHFEKPLATVRPEPTPLAGTWTEVGRIGCGGDGRRLGADDPVRELELRGDGRFSATWHPFETYRDYWGTYRFDAARRRLSLDVVDGNDPPSQRTLESTAEVNAQGELVLRGLLLFPVPSPGACGHVFRRVP